MRLVVKAGGGPYIGPRGGRWADPAHTIPWKESKEGFRAHVEAKKQERQKRLEAHRKLIKIGGEYKTEHGYVVVLPDANKPGKVRTQSFDEHGFSGHHTYDDLDALAADTLPYKGQWEPAPGILDKLSTSEQWAEGMARTLVIQALNSLGYYGQSDDVERINQHVERHGIVSAAEALRHSFKPEEQVSKAGKFGRWPEHEQYEKRNGKWVPVQTKAEKSMSDGPQYEGPRLLVKSRHAQMRASRWLDSLLDSLQPRLIVKARRRTHPLQTGMFGAGVARPPGKGWQRIPRGKRGGFRRRVGNKWQYWYPEHGKVQEKPHPEDVPEEPRLVVPVKPGERPEAVTESMEEYRTKGERKKTNEEALGIVKRAMAAGRGLTDEEALTVAGYTGKGGISGDLNQFYTPVKVAEAMWDITKAHQEGPLERVLEPSCGSGVFLQTAPKGAKVTGIELDSNAASVAEALHGHKHAVESKAFEEYTIEHLGRPLEYDSVIANPPYCVRTGDIPLHKPEYKSADKYFLDTSLDHVRDGGLLTFLIHPGVLNNQSPGWQDWREHLLARAEVVDAFRLPNTTFKHVHCGIPADILVLRKRDSRVGAALDITRRKEGLEPVLTHLGAWDESFISGDYFEERQDRILGQALTRAESGFRDTVEGSVEQVPTELRKLTAARAKEAKTGSSKPVTYDELAELAQENEALKERMSEAEAVVDAASVPPAVGNVMTIARTRYIYIGEPPSWRPMESVDDVSQIITSSGDDAVKQAHDIALDISALMRARDAGEYYTARSMRRVTADRVKAWVTEHGIPGSHRALGELSRSAPQLIDFMACVDSNGELSDLLSKDAAVTLRSAEVDKSDLLSVANYLARQTRGYVIPDDLQHNWEGWEGQSEEELRKTLLATGEYALDSSSKVGTDPSPLQHVEDYLTGNLYDKLQAEQLRLQEATGEERAQVQRQISMIKERLETKRRSIDDVPIQLRTMSWMPLDWFNAYLNSPEGRRRVFYNEERQHGDPLAQMTYESGVYKLQWIAPPEGSKRQVREGRWGPTKTVEIEPGTVMRRPTVDDHDFLKYMNRLSLRKEKVESVEEDIEKGFSEWIKESELRTELEDLYNRIFNSEFRREYSGDPLGLEGIAEGIIPHDFQNQAVRWAAETGRGILGQDVGLGKTFIAILLAKLRKQNGLARRPFVVVPKSVATNWEEEVENLFPGSRVLVIGEHKVKSRSAAKRAKAEAKELGLAGEAYDKYVEENSWATRSDNDIERNRKLAMVKQSEYDLIICTKPAFDRIPLKEKTIEEYEESDFDYERARELDRAKGSKTTETRDKRITKLKASWSQQKLAEKYKHEEALVYWEDMGIDTLIADEAHAYKNLFTARSRFGQNPKFLGASGQSKQARKMQHMSRFVREANPQHGVYLMTATPTKNSPLEVFNMLQHIAPEAFRELGIKNSEEFIDRFCKLETRLILTPPGKDNRQSKASKEEDETQFADEFGGAGNMEPALCVTGFTNLKELETVMDKYMMLQTATDVGLKIPDANQKMHMVDMTDDQKEVYHRIRAEAAAAEEDEDPGGMFRMLDQMKKAAQDLELYDPEEFRGWYVNSPKYKACVDAAYDGAMKRGGQIIFCDHNAAHERLRALLMEKGLKEAQIGIINAQVAKDSAARQAIGNRFNRGEVRVVIGNTGTMGEGVNLQGKKHEHGTTDIHHLDQPWDPGTLHQRNGRGVRQGNRAEQVNVHTFLSVGSFDGMRFSTLTGKERWLDKLRSGADSIANDMEGQSIGEVERLAMLSEDPDAAMAVIREKKASAESAWYAKQAQDAVDSFYNWQKKHQRLRKLPGQTETRDKLAADTQRLKRQLLRHELLPQEIKDHLDSGDTTAVAAATFMAGRGDAARWAAKIVRPGDVLRARSTNWVITKVNMDDRTVSVREWGFEHDHKVPIDKLSGDYKVTKYTEVDELKAKLKDSLEHSWDQPMEQIAHISEATLDANRELISETVREWNEKHGKGRNVLVRTAEGIQVAPAQEAAGKEIVYPWGKDKAELVEAIIRHNPSSERWESWQNDILEVARKGYGMSSYRPGAFRKLANRAEAAWKERQAAA